MSNWYIGQEIVAIKYHQQGKIKKGDIFNIKGLRGSCCRCDEVEIDIGVKSTLEYCTCTACNITVKDKGSIHWLSETYFAPLDSFVNHEELNNLIHETIHT